MTFGEANSTNNNTVSNIGGRLADNELNVVIQNSLFTDYDSSSALYLSDIAGVHDVLANVRCVVKI